MLFSKKTSIGSRSSFPRYLIKVITILVITIIGIVLLSKIEFPSPNKKIEKTIKNEKLKIVK
jgi:hypothetical protein